MRTLKDPAKTAYRAIRKPIPSERIVKRSDIKLNDVLINGVRLHCFKSIKNKRLLMPRNNQFQEQVLKNCKEGEEEILEEETLFQNKAIKRRLKSEPIQNFKINYQTFTPKKSKTPYQQLHKIPIEILTPSLKYKNSQTLRRQQFIEDCKLVDLNNKYYNILKKQLMMYSTNSRFNSTTIKNKIQFGKYIGLNTEKKKRYITSRESNLIQVKIQKYDRSSYFNRCRSVNAEKGTLNLSLESNQPLNASFQYSINRGINEAQCNQKLKICYSTKNYFKKWKEFIDEKTNAKQSCRSVNSEVNPQEKLFSTLAIE